MAWKSLIAGVLPFMRDESYDSGSISLANRQGPVDPSLGHWLYTWERTTSRLRETTEFEKMIGHFQFTDMVGHPWCNKGYGDAMTLAISQLMKSEVAVMLNNAASNIDNQTDGLVWDEAQSRFVLSKSSGEEQSAAAAVVDNVDAGVIMPLLASIVAKFFDDTSIGNKMRSVTDMICQLNDAEAEADLFEDSVYFCYVEDIVAATLICGESQQSVECPSSLNEYAHTNEDFPSAACRVANHTLHSGAIAAEVSFSDNELMLPLLMVDLLRSTNEGKLPRFIPTKVSLQESLTYLLLYRSNIIAASYSREPYLCGADRVKAPILIPGWTLPKVLTMMPEGDPIFSAPTENNAYFSTPKSRLRNDAVPLVFVSQSIVSPCSFVVTVRGTATMVEWVQDFEYGQTPFFADNRIRTHVGFTRILSSILPPLELFLAEQSRLHHCSCRDTHIFLTGHSLGAGVAQLVALHLALKYKLPPRIIPPSRPPHSQGGIAFGGRADQTPRYPTPLYAARPTAPYTGYTAVPTYNNAAAFSNNAGYSPFSPNAAAPTAWSSGRSAFYRGSDSNARLRALRGSDEEREFAGEAHSACPIDISAVVFAPPRVFNAYGSEQYRRLINGRIILDSGDGLAYIPCYDGNSKFGWPRCGPDHMLRTSGKGRDHYADNFGIVEIDVEYTEQRGGKTIDAVMQGIFPSGSGQNGPSVLSTLMGKLLETGIPGLGRVPSLGAMGASHVCSAACKFSQAACGSHFRWWCDKCPMLI